MKKNAVENYSLILSQFYGWWMMMIFFLIFFNAHIAYRSHNRIRQTQTKFHRIHVLSMYPFLIQCITCDVPVWFRVSMYARNDLSLCHKLCGDNYIYFLNFISMYRETWWHSGRWTEVEKEWYNNCKEEI